MTNCPVASCTKNQPCSACLAEELARRGQKQRLSSTIHAMRLNRNKGRPKKSKEERMVSLNVSVHPLFPAFLDAARATGRGEAIEQAFGFTRPTTGQIKKTG